MDIMASLIQRDELKKMLDKKEDFVLIEVLEPEDYFDFHIKGAINLPLKNIASTVIKKHEKNKKIVIYCADYNCTSSSKAVKKLENLGFENVWEYSGGKREWLITH